MDVEILNAKLPVLVF